MGDTDKLRLLLWAQGSLDKMSNSQVSLNTFASNNAVGNLGVIFDQDTKQTGNKTVLANRDTSLKSPALSRCSTQNSKNTIQDCKK